SSRRRHTRFSRDWSSDVCSSDLALSADTHAHALAVAARAAAAGLTTASSEVRHRLLDERSVAAIEDGDEAPPPGLTARELQVLEIGRASWREREQMRVAAGASER